MAAGRVGVGLRFSWSRTPLPNQDPQMSTADADDLTGKHCTPCEGDVPPLPADRVRALVDKVEGWHLSDDGKRMRRSWTAKNFNAAIEFFNRLAALAEQEGHHPDLHLEGYRNVTVELWTHAIGGLSENDFILAAKIDQVPIALRRQ
jgi:4a-hydroxytetrahydrobiopterin dehydratase